MKVLEGIRVVEAAEWVMVPSSASILADWGAEVIKIEHPLRGDPLRGTLNALGYQPRFNVYAEQNNHGKKSVGIDLNNPRGREVLMRLIASTDVFMTSYRESARQRWGITYDDVRAVNPSIVYARSSGQGPRGPDAEERGFDAVSFWARSAMGHMAKGENPSYGAPPSAGVGDMQSGVALAAGIAAALVRRGRSGEGALVDVSLFGTAIYSMYEVLAMTAAYDVDKDPEYRTSQNPRNPLTGIFTTRDGRGVILCMIDSDRYWEGFCAAIDRPAMFADVRYRSFDDRSRNYVALRAEIEDAIGAVDLADLLESFRVHGCIGAPFRTPREVLADPQVEANGYFVRYPDGHVIASSPVQFDGRANELDSGAPEVGQHTEEVLLDAGMSWDDIAALKDAHAIT